MRKQTITRWLLLLLVFVLVACGSDPADVVQDAADTVADVAEDVADNAEEIVEEVVDTATGSEYANEIDDKIEFDNKIRLDELRGKVKGLGNKLTGHEFGKIILEYKDLSNYKPAEEYTRNMLQWIDKQNKKSIKNK